MEIIGLSGCKSGSGKTELGLMLLENLRRKTGIMKGEIEEGKSGLVTDDSQIMRAENPGISPYLQSEVENVVYLRAQAENIKSALDKALGYFNDLDYLLIEGDDLIISLDPGVIIYVDEDGEEDEKCREVRERADLILNYTELHDSSQLNDIDVSVPKSEISCYRAQLISDILGWGYGEFGRLLDREDIRVRRCQLGLFN